MSEPASLVPIAHIHSDFTTKFGIPRQAGLVEGLRASLVFEPAYRSAEAVRGLEEFSHLWVVWGFSAARREGWSPTVRPPRLGGNTRLGVFATRSPYRPNPIGLSALRLAEIEHHPAHGPVLHLLGADMMDGTPVYDIKPYIPYADSHPDATAGFASEAPAPALTVRFAAAPPNTLDAETRDVLVQVLAQDPRPRYQNEPERVYGMQFAGWEVKFRVEGDVLTVVQLAQP